MYNFLQEVEPGTTLASRVHNQCMLPRIADSMAQVSLYLTSTTTDSLNREYYSDDSRVLPAGTTNKAKRDAYR